METPRAVACSATAPGTVAPPRPTKCISSEVVGGAVGVVEQAGEEVGRPGAAGQPELGHQAEDAGRVPHVDQVHRVPVQHRDEEGPEHAHGVTHRGAGQGGPAAAGVHGPQLADLRADGPVGVDDALGVGGGPRGVGDQGGVTGVDPGRCPVGPPGALQLGEAHRARRQRSGGAHHRHGVDAVEGVPHPLEAGQVVGAAEGGRGDQHPHPGPPQDVPDLLGAVEVDDGDDHRPEEGGGVEGDRRLHPVGELEGHRVAGADPPGGQAVGQAPRPAVEVGEGARPGPVGRVDPEGLVGVDAEGLVEPVAQGPVVPQPRLEPPALEVGGHGAEGPARRRRRCHPGQSHGAVAGTAS